MNAKQYLISTSYTIGRAAILVVLLNGCAVLDQNGLGLLEGRGVQRISTSNPFIASNQALSRESEQSPELAGFLEKAGQPRTLEVTREDLWSPLKVTLHYGEETYLAEKLFQGWIIQGPLDGAPKRNRPSTSPLKAAHPIPTEPPLATPVVLRGDPIVIEQPKQRMIKSDATDAEITPRGDLVHYVIQGSENLQRIASWYTGSEDNSGRIARINQLTESQSLEPGDTVVIPNYLVQRRERLGIAP